MTHFECADCEGATVPDGDNLFACKSCGGHRIRLRKERPTPLVSDALIECRHCGTQTTMDLPSMFKCRDCGGNQGRHLVASGTPHLVSLDELRLEPVPSVVEMFEELLEKAKEGRIRSAAVALGIKGRYTGTAHDCSDGNLADLIMAIERLKLRLLDGTIADIVESVIE